MAEFVHFSKNAFGRFLRVVSQDFCIQWRGRQKDFFPAGAISRFFQVGPKVVKFNFSVSILRKRPYFAKNVIENSQISKPRRRLWPPYTPPSDAYAQLCDW